MAKWNTVEARRARKLNPGRERLGDYLGKKLLDHAKPEIAQEILNGFLRELGMEPMAYEGEKEVRAADGKVFKVVCFESGEDATIEIEEPTLVIKYTGLLKVVAYAPAVIFCAGDLELDAFAPVAVTGGIGGMRIHARENTTIEVGRKGLELLAAPHLDVMIFDGEAEGVRRRAPLCLRAPNVATGTIVVERFGGWVKANFEGPEVGIPQNLTIH